MQREQQVTICCAEFHSEAFDVVLGEGAKQSRQIRRQGCYVGAERCNARMHQVLSAFDGALHRHDVPEGQTGQRARGSRASAPPERDGVNGLVPLKEALKMGVV